MPLIRPKQFYEESYARIDQHLFPDSVATANGFVTPWHKFVHGLGLGYPVSDYNHTSIENLISMDKVLLDTHRTPYQVFIHRLFNWIIVFIEPDNDVNTPAANASSFEKILDAMARLDEDLERARACCLLLECISSLGVIELYKYQLLPALFASLAAIEDLDCDTDKVRYEKQHLRLHLLRVAAEYGWTVLLSRRTCDNTDYVNEAIESLCRMNDYFYLVRSAALLLITMSDIGLIDRVIGKDHNYLSWVLDVVDKNFSTPTAYAPDGIHENNDYLFFPLCLLVNSIAYTGSATYLNYKRDWPGVLDTLYWSLSPRSRSSQAMFYVLAHKNLEASSHHLHDQAKFLQGCIHDYLEVSDGKQMDDYLRTCYLIHMAGHLGHLDILPPSLWTRLKNSLYENDNYSEETSPYGSYYMVLAYTLSSYHLAGRLNELNFNDISKKLHTVGTYNEHTDSNILKLDYVFIDVALQMRSQQPLAGFE